MLPLSTLFLWPWVFWALRQGSSTTHIHVNDKDQGKGLTASVCHLFWWKAIADEEETPIIGSAF